MTELLDTKIKNGKNEYTFSVDVVISSEKTYTDDQLTQKKARLEARKVKLTESLSIVDSELEEINALIALI